MSEKEIEKTPLLRFKAYADAWKKLKLGDVAEFSKGSGYTKADLQEMGTPVILYGSLYTNYQTWVEEVDTYVEEKKGSVISEGNEVIVPASGESPEDIARASVIVESGIILGGDLNIIKSNERMVASFLALTISNGKQKKELCKRAQGKSIVHLHNSDLKEVNVIYPSKDEQGKISYLFKLVDEIIILQQRELDLLKLKKQTLVSKMFPKAGEVVPELRFSGFTDDWEQRKLGGYIEDFIEKTTKQNQYPVLTSSQKQGIVLQEEYFANRQVTTDDNVGYFVLPRGYFTYRSRSDNDVFVFNRNNLIDKGIISYFYPVFKVKNADSDFFLKRINNGIEREIAIAAEGTGQHVLSLKKFKNIDTMFPNIEEQVEIGRFFKALDNTIALHQRKLDTIKGMKKTLLKNMFV